jgi:hypothetical protein
MSMPPYQPPPSEPPPQQPFQPQPGPPPQPPKSQKSKRFGWLAASLFALGGLTVGTLAGSAGSNNVTGEPVATASATASAASEPTEEVGDETQANPPHRPTRPRRVIGC